MLPSPLPELRCPLCGADNECAVARTGAFATACWCREVMIDPEVLACVPESRRDRACLCRRCTEALGKPTLE